VWSCDAEICGVEKSPQVRTREQGFHSNYPKNDRLSESWKVIHLDLLVSAYTLHAASNIEPGVSEKVNMNESVIDPFLDPRIASRTAEVNGTTYSKSLVIRGDGTTASTSSDPPKSICMESQRVVITRPPSS